MMTIYEQSVAGTGCHNCIAIGLWWLDQGVFGQHRTLVTHICQRMSPIVFRMRSENRQASPLHGQHHRRKSESAATVRIVPTSSTPATSASMRKTSPEPNTWSMLPVRATTRGDPATMAQPRGLLHRSIVPGIRVLRRRRFDSSPRNPQVDIGKVAMSSTDRPSPQEIWAAEH